MPGGREEQISPPHDFGHAHGGIIHHHRQFVSRDPVPPPDHEIAEVPPRPECLRSQPPMAGTFLSGRATLLGDGAAPAEAVAAACDWVAKHVAQPITVTGADHALASRAFKQDDRRYYLLHNSTDELLEALYPLRG